MNVFTAKRITRGVYALYIIPCLIFSFFLNIVSGQLEIYSSYGQIDSVYTVIFLVSLALCLFLLVVEVLLVVKRLLDIGKSGYLAFLLIVPLVNLILVIALCFWPPKKEQI
jgi:uncharacterized membrane protein YhaH (DUF805 family)